MGMFLDYYQMRDWLESFIPLVYGKEELGLARIAHLLELLGNPENKFKSVHIAGTSGKGSTAFYIAQLLQFARGSVSSFPPASVPRPFLNSDENPNLKIDSKKGRVRAVLTVVRQAGSLSRTATARKNGSIVNCQSSIVKVGLHISPHLNYIGERMQIFSSRHPEPFDLAQGKLREGSIPVKDLIGLIGQIRPIIEKIQADKPDLTPSYFEILVAASFLHFAREKVDWAVVEVGLGGRLDATNVLMPELSVITNIGLDHTEILGDTVEKIAFEKAGIIKAGVPVVTGAMGKALGVIAKVAKDKGAPLFILRAIPFSSHERESREVAKKVGSRLRSNYNSDLAVKAAEALGFKVDEQMIGQMASTGLPGRFEKIEPGVILDGAHNTDKMKFLIRQIKNLTSDKLHVTLRQAQGHHEQSRMMTSDQKLKSIVNGQMSIVLVLAFKKGKDWKKMVDLLIKEFQISNFKFQIKQVIATEFQTVTDTGKFAGVDPEEIANYVISNFQFPISNVKCFGNSQEAVFNAVTRVKEPESQRARGLVLVTGSLYLVGEARTMWKLPEV